MAMSVQKLLEGMIRVNASDLHLKVGGPPMIRLHGHLHPVEHPPLLAEDTEAANEFMMPAKCKEQLDREGTVDYSFGLTLIDRFRVNCYHQRGVKSLAIRKLMSRKMDLAELNLPTQIGRFAELQRGMVLVTGITGCGKTTTLAAIINIINSTRREHIITIEDPIEFVYKDERSVIDQVEIHHDVINFSCALRHALRQDPDIILIGECRDRETIQTAMHCVETGHLVFSTLHTRSAVQTVSRITHFYNQEEQEQIFDQIADNLEGVVCQRLLPTADGKGRVPCCEIMFNNAVTKKLIRERRIEDIEEVLKSGQDGMHTFDLHLVELVKAGRVTLQDATLCVGDAASFRRLLQGRTSAGDRGSLVG